MRKSFFSGPIAGLVIVLLFGARSSSAVADDPGEGMVLGQTVTVAGQDFFQGFVASWREKRISERTLLMVRERPSARTGSLIWIEHRGQRVLQLSLPASRARVRGMSEQAAEAVWQRLTQQEIDASLENDTDLARDEL